MWGRPERPDGLGCHPLPTPPHPRQRWWRGGRAWRRQRCGGQRRVRGSLGGRVASAAPPSSLPSLLPPHGVPSAHGGLVARSASGGSERARAVASAAMRWPSSWMVEVMELGCDICARVRWRRRSMCLTSEIEHGWWWWRAVEHGWRPERPGGLGSFPSTRSPSPCSTSADLNHSSNRSNGLGDSLASLKASAIPSPSISSPHVHGHV
jgi:hypothetical protein